MCLDRSRLRRGGFWQSPRKFVVALKSVILKPNVDRQRFSEWIDRWIALWHDSNPQPSDIEALFTEDATWSFQPYESEPARGRASVVHRWLENIDPPGSWECHYVPLAVDGEVAVAQGWSRYEADRGAARDVMYCKPLVCSFSVDGRCSSLVECTWRPRSGDNRARTGRRALPL
jgi:SnoaL-like domain